MPRPAIAFLLWALSLAACSLSKPNPSYCARDADCPSGSRCNLNSCVTTDAGTGGRDGGDAGSDTPGPECTSNTHCTTAGKRVCDPSVSMCVGCLGPGDCNGTTPLCEAKTCRACRSDTECGTDPGICLADGRCATSGEVVFVEFKAAGCSGADGTSSAPYCAPSDGVAALTSTRRVMLIRGPADGRLALNTNAISPVVIGRKNAGGDDGSIPATAATALLVSSDDALVRDLTISSGTASTSKGIVAAGASTKLTLLRVKVSLGTGLGVEANTGAELRMDRCVVENNLVGGLLINGATYDIANSVFAGNGYGVQFSSTPIPGSPRFWFNTVLGATATLCDLNNPRALSDSIVVGTNANCTLTNSITVMPTFSSARPYHLTGPLACPAAPSAVPDHDIDGEPRAVPVDCGADEYVP